MQPTQPTLPPTYKQMLEAMGQQLSSRKSALMKRVLLIVWPFILLIALGYLSAQINFSFPGVAVGVYIALAIIYSAVVGFIFTIEKQIWIDSYFDQKNLSLEESWRIAKKLLWPAVVFRFKVSVRYYLIPIGAAFLILVAAAAFFSMKEDQLGVAATWIGAFIIFVLFALAYSVYFRVRLRYAWFVFLDTYGTDTSYGSITSTIDKLNAISRSEIFLKSLVVNFGTDSIDAIARIAVGTISIGLAQFGGAGKALGQMAEVYGKELSRQAADLGNISAQYILYRFARKEAFGQEQEINENIYKI